jgi:DNA end-binding protein Ku
VLFHAPPIISRIEHWAEENIRRRRMRPARARALPRPAQSRREARNHCIMRAIWKGSISFGLVNIPIALYPATRKEELRFRLLRAKDHSPVNYKRVAEKDGKEVPWDEIVKGYEYEKGKFVVLNEKDFQRVDLEATQTVDIQDFVDLEEIDPMYFYKPYHLEPQKGGDKAYVLLREALADGKKVGIAKVVIKTRQYLAGVKALKHALVLELMHFAEELADPEKLKVPKKLEVGKREKEMAKALVESMSSSWDPEKYHDDYREALMEVIEEKVESGGKEIEEKPKAKKESTKVIDLVAVLQESLAKSQGAKRKKSAPKRAAKHHAKKAA